MPNDLKTGLYACPECGEVFELRDEVPICEACLSLLDRCPAEKAEAAPIALAA